MSKKLEKKKIFLQTAGNVDDYDRAQDNNEGTSNTPSQQTGNIVKGEEKPNNNSQTAKSNATAPLNTPPKPTIKKKGFIKKKAEEIREAHSQGHLSELIGNIFSTFGSYITLFIMILTLPAMPVIFYLTILYNVIILTWEKFKNLDTYAGAK